MSHKYKIGEKVKILWHKTPYTTTPDYKDTGEVRGYVTLYDGTSLVVLFEFHKYNKHHRLNFPFNAIRPLKEVVKDGDVL